MAEGELASQAILRVGGNYGIMCNAKFITYAASFGISGLTARACRDFLTCLTRAMAHRRKTKPLYLSSNMLSAIPLSPRAAGEPGWQL